MERCSKTRKNKIILLGTGTCQIQKHRMASSILVEMNNLRLVYDFGRGTSQRLVELGLKQDDLKQIIISHFHPDHLSDLIPYLHAASWSQIDLRNKDLNIYGPVGLKDQLMRLLGSFEQDELTREFFKVNLREVHEEKFSIKNRQFEFIDLPPANNHGLKFKFKGKIYAFTGDSNLHQEEIDFLREVDLGVIDAGHITDEEVIELAVSTQAKTIICSYLYRELDEEKLNTLAKKEGYQGKLIVGKDLMNFDI